MDNIMYIEKIENAFSDYIQGKTTISKLCMSLSVIIEVLSTAMKHDKHFNVSIIDGKDQFLGMCVYPNTGELADVMATCPFSTCAVFSENWNNKITKYDIEIDSNVLNRSIIAFNPQELTAMLLHELSHVVFSSKKSEQLYFAYRSNMEALKMQDKSTLKTILGLFYAVPGIIICGIHAWNIGKDGTMEEFICDQVFGNAEYQEHMVSALNKIIKAYGNTLILNDGQQKDLLDKHVKWCNLNIVQIARRRELLRTELFYQSAGTKSKAIRKVYLNISARIGLGMRDKYANRLIAMEAVIDKIDNGELELNGILQKYAITTGNITASAAMEAVVNTASSRYASAMEATKGKGLKLPSKYDIDAIAIEIDRIENHHDRIYVLDLIYTKIEQIENFRDYAEMTGQLNKYKVTIESELTDLERLRQAVLAKRIIGTKYSLFVKCPAGYDG